MATVRMYTTMYCPYCMQAKALLKERGVESIDEIAIDGRPDERETMIRLTGKRTVPQIFIGETYVGGCDDLHDLDSRGGLRQLLAGPDQPAG